MLALAAYDTYRAQAAADPESRTAMRFYEDTQCFIS